ncbi:MAG TPA: GGDEF domain-containing protein [Clostridia bacterium]|nr:GGDEF domain-containing protein [Clostridia bacterium]
MKIVKQLLKEGTNLIYNDIKEAKNLFRRAKILAESIQWDHGQLRAALYLAKLDYPEEGYNKTLNKMLDIEEIALQKKNSEFLAETKKELGNLNYNNRNLGIALNYYFDALKVLKNKNSPLDWKLLNNIGMIYSDLEKYDYAKKYYLEALNVHNIYEEHLNIILFTNIGSIYKNIGEYKVAKSYFEIVIETEKNSRNKNTLYIALNCIALGEIYFIEGKVNKAKECYEAGIKDLLNYNNIFPYVKYLLKYCIFLVMEDATDAEKMLELGIEYSKENKNFKLLSKFLELYGDLYNAKENELAMHYYKRSIFYSKKALNRLNSLQIDQINQFKIINEQESKYKMLAREYENIEKINEIGLSFMETLDLEVVYKKIYDNFSEEMGFDKFGIAIYDEKKQHLKYDYFILKGRRKEPFVLDLSNMDTIANYVIENKEPVITKKYSREYKKYIKHGYPTPKKDAFDQESIIYIPLVSKGKVIGTFSVQADNEAAFNETDFEYLKSLSYFITSAINNAIIREALEDMNYRLDKMAKLDDLTDLYNKREFLNISQLELKSAIRNQTPVSLLMIDIDFFKEYNDFYGHIAGDEVILKISNILKSVFKRKNDCISRFGGDEFIVFLPNIDHPGLINIITLLQEEINKIHIRHKKSPYDYITVSIGGVFANPSIDLTIQSLIETGDVMMYKVKHKKKNSYDVTTLGDSAC